MLSSRLGLGLKSLAGVMITLLVPAAMAGQTGVAIRSEPAHRVYFNRYQLPAMTLHVADRDGGNERGLFANPGLEYSPSYSPDGRWIVFTREQAGQADIFRVHPDGSGEEQLTNHPAFDDQAALSPDGRSMAFVSTRDSGTANLWVMDVASRAARNLTRHQSGNFRPQWSPDGQWIAFSSDRGPSPGVQPGRWPQLQSTGIYLIRPNGTGLRRLTREGGVAGSPSWSADGTRVIFYETDEIGALLAKGAQSRTDIAAVNVASGRRELLTGSNETKLSPHWLLDGRISYTTRSADNTAGLSIVNPNLRVDRIVRGAVRNSSWAPDGSRVVFERVDSLGAPQHFVPTFSRESAFPLVLTEPFPSFSPDRKTLVYSQMGSGKSAAAGVPNANLADTSIEIMNADGSAKRTLFHRAGFSAFSAAFSPRGDEVALSIGRYFRAPGAPPAQIALVKPDGSDFRLVVDDSFNNGFPTWSPDGTRLAFKRGRQLVIMSLADRVITPLTNDANHDNFPQWSPKGDRILFTSDRSGSFELYTIKPDGTDLLRLTRSPGDNAHAAWCSDGEWIVFSSGRMGFKDEMAQFDGIPQPYGEIFAMRADGSDVRQLTDNKWEDASAACTQ